MMNLVTDHFDDQKSQMFLKHQAHQCIAHMTGRICDALGDDFDGFEVILTHSGDRIDLTLSMPVASEKRLVIERALGMSVEFAPPFNYAAADCRFPLPAVGSVAQVGARHQSAMAMMSGTTCDGLAEFHCGASALRYMFSSHIDSIRPDWLAKTSPQRTLTASFGVAANGNEFSFIFFTPLDLLVKGSGAPFLTLH